MVQYNSFDTGSLLLKSLIFTSLNGKMAPINLGTLSNFERTGQKLSARVYVCRRNVRFDNHIASKFPSAVLLCAWVCKVLALYL